jgi:hypothetical protein
MWVGFTKNISNDIHTMIKMAVMNNTSHDNIKGKIVIKITTVKFFYRTGHFYARFFLFRSFPAKSPIRTQYHKLFTSVIYECL